MSTSQHDITEVTAEDERQPGEHGSFVVTVKTPAGFSKTFRVTDATRVATLTRKAVGQFIAAGELGEGNYRLVLVRSGGTTDLVASARIGDADVHAGDELALVTTDPQVDG
jgi:hypothetical protein